MKCFSCKEDNCTPTHKSWYKCSEDCVYEIGNVLKHDKTKPIKLNFSTKICSIVKANNYILVLSNPSIESCPRQFVGQSQLLNYCQF